MLFYRFQQENSQTLNFVHTALEQSSSIAPCTTTTSLLANQNNQQQENVTDIIGTIAGSIEVLNDEIQQLNDESLQQSQLIATVVQYLKVLKTQML